MAEAVKPCASWACDSLTAPDNKHICEATDVTEGVVGRVGR